MKKFCIVLAMGGGWAILSPSTKQPDPAAKPGTKNMKIILTDTFNNKIISTHRSIKAAVRKRLAHSRAVKRANGPSSYLTYKITADDGVDIRDAVAEEIDQQRGGW